MAHLPRQGFLGISSATGDLVDNHDIIEFSMRSLAGVDDAAADQARDSHRTTVPRVPISPIRRVPL